MERLLLFTENDKVSEMKKSFFKYYGLHTLMDTARYGTEYNFLMQ